MMVMNGGQVHVDCNTSESVRTKKRIFYYHWNHGKLMFKELIVPKLEITQINCLDLYSKFDILVRDVCLLKLINTTSSTTKLVM
jgi:hypothetical protein